MPCHHHVQDSQFSTGVGVLCSTLYSLAEIRADNQIKIQVPEGIKTIVAASNRDNVLAVWYDTSFPPPNTLTFVPMIYVHSTVTHVFLREPD